MANLVGPREAGGRGGRRPRCGPGAAGRAAGTIPQAAALPGVSGRWFRGSGWGAERARKASARQVMSTGRPAALTARPVLGASPSRPMPTAALASGVTAAMTGSVIIGESPGLIGGLRQQDVTRSGRGQCVQGPGGGQRCQAVAGHVGERHGHHRRAGIRQPRGHGQEDRAPASGRTQARGGDRPARRPRSQRHPGPPLRRSPDGQPRDRDQARSVPGTPRRPRPLSAPQPSRLGPAGGPTRCAR